MSDTDYKSILLKIYTDYDSIIKDLFATLYLDIHASIESKVDTLDQQYIENLKGYPEELDLNETLQRFWFNHYQLDLISKEKGNYHFAFSLGGITELLRRSPFYKKQDLVIKIKKKFESKYSLGTIDQFCWIAREVVRWRNIAFHSDGISNSSQASILFSNISLLLKIYPDDLRKKIRNIESFEKIISEDFLGSTLVNTKFENNLHVPEDIDNEMIAFLENEHNASENKLNEIDISQEEIKQSIIKIQSSIDSFNDSFNETKTSLMEIKKEFILSREKQSFQEETQDTQAEEKQRPTKDDNQSVENIIYKDNNRKKTNSEIRDELLILRNKIKDHMLSKHPQFKNWHNILMEPLVNQILIWDIKTSKDFKNDVIIRINLK